MSRRAARRVPSTEVKTHFGRIVQEVASTNTPVIIQTRGQDQAAIVSLSDLQSLSSKQESLPESASERLRATLREAGLLTETPPEMTVRALEYDHKHSSDERHKTLAELRSIHIDPSLSESILASRERRTRLRQTRKKD